MNEFIPPGYSAIGRCGLCGGLVTAPTIWHSVTPPPKRCTKCGAYASEHPDLPVLPMNPKRIVDGTDATKNWRTHE